MKEIVVLKIKNQEFHWPLNTDNDAEKSFSMNKFVPFLLLTILLSSIAGCSQRNREAEALTRLETQKAERLAKEKQAAAAIERKKREVVVLRAAIERHMYEQAESKGEEYLKNSNLMSIVAKVKGVEGLNQLYKPGNLASNIAGIFPHSDTPLAQQTDHSGVLRFTPEEVKFAESIDVGNLSSGQIREIYDTQ